LFQIDFGGDWRAHYPVWMDIGPVLAIGDGVANKVCALYSRAEPRDYLDVDAIRQAGIFTDDELLTLAGEHAPGVDSTMFAAQLDTVAQLTAEDVAEYGVNDHELDHLKRRFLAWQTGLTNSSPRPDAPPEIYERVDPIPRNLQHHRFEASYRPPTPGPGISL